MAALGSFVLGVGLLQWLPMLPGVAMLVLVALLAVAAAVVAQRMYPNAANAAVAANAADARARVRALLCLAALLAGFAYAGGRADVRLTEELAFADEGRDFTVTGVVASLPVRLDRGVRFEFDIERVDSKQADIKQVDIEPVDGPVDRDSTLPARVLLGWYATGEVVRPGERWRFTIRLRRPHGAINPAGFDIEAWMLERNLRASGYVRDGRASQVPERLESMVWRPFYAVERARAWLRDRLIISLGSARHGGVLLALVIGDQRAISEPDWTLFNRTGIAHLVSISGLHVTMLAALAAGVTGALWRRSPRALAWWPVQSAALLAGALTALAYALLAGWGVPAQRTVIMLATVAIAWSMRARFGPGTALAAAAAMVCLIDPWAVTAAGFWLSFGAVASIFWVMHGRVPQQRAAGGGWSWRAIAVAAARVQLAVTLALIPATVMLFQQLSVVSPLANLLAIPLVSWIVTPLALLGAMFAALPAPLSALAAGLLGLANGVFSILWTVLEAMASAPWAALAVAAPPWPLAALALAGVAWLLAPRGWPLRWIGLVALLPLFVWPVARPQAGELWLTALDVGQGSAVVIETRAQTWLYDAGPRYSSDTDAGQRVILPYLRARGITVLDGMIVSHLDSDHSGGAASVLAGVAVGRVLSSVAPGSPVLAGARAHERCVAGQIIVAGDLVMRMLHPDAADYAQPRSTNAMSCVVEVRIGGTSALLTGDVPAAEEAAMLARGTLTTMTWIAVPHHGSRSSSSEALLQAVQPAWAAVQSGYRNRFGHPDSNVLARYQRHGVTVERTDRSGALQWRFRADGSVQLLRWRSVARRYWHDRPEGLHERSGHEAAPTGDDATDEAPRDPFIGG